MADQGDIFSGGAQGGDKRGGGGLEGMEVTASTIESIEKDFVDVMKDLSAEENLDRFRAEFEKLHRALKKSHESEKRLIKKCQELNAEIVANAGKVQSALKLSQEDQNTIHALKKEVEKAWKMVDAAHEKEARAKEAISGLKKEIANLSQLVEQGAGLTVGQESSVQELVDQKKELTKELTTANQKVAAQGTEIKELSERYRKVESELAIREDEFTKLNERSQQLRRDYETEVKKRERNDKELKELNNVLTQRQNDIRQKSVQIQQANDNALKLEKDVKDERDKLREVTQLKDKIKKELDQRTTYMEDLDAQLGQSQQQVAQLNATIAAKEQEIHGLRAAEQKLHKSKEQQVKMVKKAAQERDDQSKAKEGLKCDIVSLERNVEACNKEIETLKAELKEVTRDRDVLQKKFLEAQAKHGELASDIKVAETRQENLNNEIQGHRGENQKQRKIIYDLEKDRETYAKQASDALTKYYKALEEVKIGRMKIMDFQKQVQEAEGKLKGQQNLYEAVRADRNLYSKQVIEATDEINEMKRKQQMMNHQIEQLKEELTQKEKRLAEAYWEKKNLDRKVEDEKQSVQDHKSAFEKSNRKNQGLEQQIKQLNQIIKDCDQDRQKQKKKLNSVMNERDILGTQLIRRNDELALLYEKIRIQQSTLNKGEIQYRDRIVDIRMLRLKINDLKRDLHISQQRMRNIEELKRQVNTLQKSVMGERSKVKALSEELENPMNVHRWRKLEGSDPKEHEMIKKIQTLQTRLIAKTEEVVEKDIVIQEKEKLYIELKNILARQPGPEIAEQLNIYHENLRKRNVQMKRMASELNMMSTQLTETKYERERLNRELQEVKKKYYEQKMRNQLLERDRALSAPAKGATTAGAGAFPLQHPPAQARYAGGGFSLST